MNSYEFQMAKEMRDKINKQQRHIKMLQEENEALYQETKVRKPFCAMGEELALLEHYEKKVVVLDKICSDQTKSIELCKRIIAEMSKQRIVCNICGDTGYLKDMVTLGMPPKPIPCTCVLGQYKKENQ